jgi:outer membrane protein insertion porin family
LPKALILSIFAFNFLLANTIQNFKLEGLTQISQKIALEKLSTSDLNDAIKDFYDFGYFDDVEVYKEQNNTIRIKFTEKPFVVNLEMDGYKTREEDLDILYSSMQIKKGTMYTKEKIDNSKKILIEELKKEGYVNSVVEVDVEKINPQSVVVRYSVNKGSELIIKKINYIGAKNLGDYEFNDYIANKEEDLISWWFGNSDGVMQLSQLEYDNHRIKDVYYQYGYLDARVSAAYSKIDVNTNTAEIDYNIFEGNQYMLNDIVIYTDESIVPLEDLKEGLSLKLNKHFNILNLRKDINYIKTKIADQGFAFAEVNYDIRKDKEKKTTDVILNVIPGNKVYINDVIISGNNRTLDRVIRRNVYLAPKDLFSLTDLRDSNAALSRSGYFESVSVKKKKISDTLVNIEVNVKEAATGNLIFGGGYGSYDGFMLNASVQDQNIFGSGMNLGLSFEHSSKKDLGKISLSNPAIHDSIYNGSFSIYKEENIITASDTSTSGDETTKLTGASVGIGRNIGRNTKIGALYAIEDKEISYEINVSEGSTYTSSSITPYISYNSTDDFYVPRNGIKAGYSYKFVGIGGDAKYTLDNAYLKYFHGLEDYIDLDWIFRFKTTIKKITDKGNIPEDTTLYLGGPSSLRGYESYAFQPDDNGEPFKKSWSNTVELSFPLIEKAKMRWALFYDYGMIGENSFNDIEKKGYGVSINWYSPVGPIQFIFSRAHNPLPEDEDKTSNFEFSLGTTF